MAIKAHTPAGSLPAKVLYYQNTNSGLPYYAMAAAIADRTMRYSGNVKECLPAAPSHHGGDGMLPNYRSFSWDHRNPAVTAHFVESFRNATSGALGGALDGTFMDTTACYNAGSGQAAASLATGQAMQRAVPGKIVAFHTCQSSAALSGAALGMGGAMDYTIAMPTTVAAAAAAAAAVAVGDGGQTSVNQSGARAVEWMAANGAAGVLSLAHIGDTAYGTNYNYSLAVFLAGANNRSYFAFSSTYKKTPDFDQRWTDCSDTYSPANHTPVPGTPSGWPQFPTWCAGQGYSPDYDRPLGAPTGPAAPTGKGKMQVARAFASGTTVRVDLLGATCLIRWADGGYTVCEAGAGPE